MATTKRDSRIVAEMLETARGLQVAGLFTRRRIGEFNALGPCSTGERTRGSA